MTPSTALRLAKLFGMSEDFWLSMQLRWDSYKAKQAEAKELKIIKPFNSAKLLKRSLAIITNGYKKMSELHKIAKRQFDKQALFQQLASYKKY